LRRPHLLNAGAFPILYTAGEAADINGDCVIEMRQPALIYNYIKELYNSLITCDSYTVAAMVMFSTFLEDSSDLFVIESSVDVGLASRFGVFSYL
jgi:hypothetical protein